VKTTDLIWASFTQQAFIVMRVF